MPIGATGPISFSAVYTEVFGGIVADSANVRMAKSNPTSTPSLVANAAIGATFSPAGSSGPYELSSFRSYSGVTGASQAIFLSNTSLDITITDCRVNGVSISGASFPLIAGNNTTGYTTELGSYTVEFDRSNAISGQHIGISDSNGSAFCETVNAGSSTVSFLNVVISLAELVAVDIGDGTCT